VYKDFSDNSAASVSVSLSCTSGTVTNSPRLASEGSPALFNISGAVAGATCTATEPTVPSGYTKNESGCRNKALNGSCTIVNTKSATGAVDIVRTGFETGQAEGWSLSGGAKLDSSVAIGQYSLLLENNGTTSVRSVSTAGYSGVSVTMHMAAQGLAKGDACFAELSTNGGSSWTTVLQLNSSGSNPAFQSASVTPSAASNNSNLRLRYRVEGGAKPGETCWGDDIVVRGTSMSGTQGSAKTEPDSLQFMTDESGLTAVAADSASEYGSSGFDPGFDNLIGDGSVERQVLTYEALMSGAAPDDLLARSAYSVPAGAATPEHTFAGWLELSGPAEGALPDLSVNLLQIGNHLVPLALGANADGSAQADYSIGTGRVWRESGDHGFSRASLPFTLMQPGTDCPQEGVLTFLFSDDGATSNAVYQVSGGCGAAMAELRGVLEAAYAPAEPGASAPGIEAVLACATDNWLPLVQGGGGFSWVLMPDNSVYYELRDGDTVMLLDATQQSAAMDSLCD
jgi:hypothetical protein